MINVCTIGFAEKKAEGFFGLLKGSQATHLMDVRLNNVSQLAGFTKKDDLRFFVKEILGWKYSHVPELAPTKDILDSFKKHGGDWAVYEDAFINLMERRRIETTFSMNDFDKACLLCSEHKPHHCHRRLVVEYLNSKWGGNMSIKHLF
jgi:uncharacterized protein (DUF488 family)